MTLGERTHGKDAPLVGASPMIEKFLSPRGRQVTMLVRPETSDHNTLYSCLNEDEYGLRDVDLGDGTALDIGAHIGGVTIALAVDNPNATVIAVEALSENVKLLTANVRANGVEDRVTIIHAIAGRPGGANRKGTVKWNFDGGEAGQHHRYIANAQGIPQKNAQREKADIWSLDELVPARFMKIDCEGCEYELLRSEAVSAVDEIRGEFHAGFEELHSLLFETHVVTLTSGNESFGGFRAAKR